MRCSLAFSSYLGAQLACASVNKNAANVFPDLEPRSQLLSVSHVTSELFEVLRGGRALFAFDDEDITVSVQQQNVKPRAIRKDQLTR